MCDLVRASLARKPAARLPSLLPALTEIISWLIGSICMQRPPPCSHMAAQPISIGLDNLSP